MTAKEVQEKLAAQEVRKVHPCAFRSAKGTVWSERGMTKIRLGTTWQNAAESLPAQPEDKQTDGELLIMADSSQTTIHRCPSLPAQPEQAKLTDVYEVYGKSARSQGWDFMVCNTLKEALGVIESDLDELDADPDKEDELRIVFRRYTESQMEDVIYE